MSNSDAATAAAAEIEDVNGKAKMEPAAASVADGTVKRKKRKKPSMKQQEANDSDSRTVEQESTSVVAAGSTMQGVPKLKRKKEAKAKEGEMVEQDPTTELISASGVPKLKEAKAKQGEMAEQDATTNVVSEGASKLKKKKAKAKEGEIAEQDATTKVVSASEGAPKVKEAKAKEGEMAKQDATTKVDSASEGAPKLKRKKEGKAKAKEGEMAEQDAITKVVSVSEGEPKLKKEAKAKAKEGEMVEQDATTKVVSASEGIPQLKNKEEAKAKEGEMVEQEATTKVVSAFVETPKHKKEEVNERGMLQERASTSAVSEGTPKCKKKKSKGRDMAEHEATTATVSASQGTKKCNKKEKKAKETGMAKQETTSTTVSASEETLKCKKNKEKEETIIDVLEPSATISASEGTPKRKKKKKKKKKKKLKKKNTMQEQQESPQSGLVSVDKIVANKPGSSFTNGEGSSRGSDVSMDPINEEDPDCPEAKVANDRLKCEAVEEIQNCSENFSLLQETSEDRKTPISGSKKKRKRDASSRGPSISSQDGVSVDSSLDRDRSCIHASHLVEAHNKKFKNIYSPGGSLIRFQRKKLLILDLNGLLADINMDYRNAHMAHGKVKNKLVFKRPYCDDFLQFCFQSFEVGIWSSRLKDNVNAVINILMPKLKQHLLFCWDMSKCTTTGCNTLEKSFKPLVLKELKKLWNKDDPDLPWEQGEFSPSNTLLVDDSPYKAVCNPPHTAIFPQAYSYLNQRDDYSLGPGGDLRVYLEKLAAADDVQVFIRDNPFGQPSITESDPNWNFYAKIVDKVVTGFFPKKKKWRGFSLKRKHS